MDYLPAIITAVLVCIILFILLRLFSAPMRVIFKLALNTGLGFVGLIVFNAVGSLINLSLGINWINALVVGVLGVPGLGLLMLLNWLSML